MVSAVSLVSPSTTIFTSYETASSVAVCWLVRIQRQASVYKVQLCSLQRLWLLCGIATAVTSATASCWSMCRLVRIQP